MGATKYVTPVNVEVGEDMVVMDGVLVSDAGHGNGRSAIERDACGALDENGICRNGSKCVVDQLFNFLTISH